MLSKINLDAIFSKKPVKVNDMYKVLTGDLGVRIEIADLKALNRFLINKQLELED